MRATSKKEPQRAPLLLPCEDTAMRLCEPGSGPSPNTKSAHALILDFAASRTVRNVSVVYMPPSLWYSAIAAKQTKMYLKTEDGFTDAIKCLFIPSPLPFLSL